MSPGRWLRELDKLTTSKPTAALFMDHNVISTGVLNNK